jgi:hypothetical protein
LLRSSTLAEQLEATGLEVSGDRWSADANAGR